MQTMTTIVFNVEVQAAELPMLQQSMPPHVQLHELVNKVKSAWTLGGLGLRSRRTSTLYKAAKGQGIEQIKREECFDSALFDQSESSPWSLASAKLDKTH